MITARNYPSVAVTTLVFGPFSTTDYVDAFYVMQDASGSVLVRAGFSAGNQLDPDALITEGQARIGVISGQQVVCPVERSPPPGRLNFVVEVDSSGMAQGSVWLKVFRRGAPRSIPPTAVPVVR